MEIYDLAFNLDTTMVAISSSSTTVHIFNIKRSTNQDLIQSQGYIDSIGFSSSQYLQEGQRSDYKLRNVGAFSRCCFGNNNDIIAVSLSGSYFVGQMTQAEIEI